MNSVFGDCKALSRDSKADVQAAWTGAGLLTIVMYYFQTVYFLLESCDVLKES